jgi:hypothetical protein
MARSKFSLDFDGFLDLAERISEAGGEAALKKATENALAKSAEIANAEVAEAMNKSRYSFTAGVKGSKGRARRSAAEVAAAPVTWEGTQATAKIGVSLAKAPEVAILMHGAPHIKPDTQLKNAIKVKGKVRKKVDEVQAAEFNAVMREIMEGGGNG